MLSKSSPSECLEEMNQPDSETAAFRSSLDVLPEKQIRGLYAKSKENLDFQFRVDNLV